MIGHHVVSILHGRRIEIMGRMYSFFTGFPFRIVLFHFSFDITGLAFHVISKLHDFIIFVFHVVLILHM